MTQFRFIVESTEIFVSMICFSRLFGLVTWLPIARGKLIMSPNSAVYLLVGNTLTLSCSGEPGDGINISTIHFEKGDRTPLQSYVQLSSEGAQLQIHAMTANGRGMYHYCFNEEPADRTGTFVWVGDAPEVISTISKWSNNLDDVVIQFCSKRSNVRWNLAWTQRRSSAHCNNTDEMSECRLKSLAHSDICHTCRLSAADNIDFNGALYGCVVGENILTDIHRVEPRASEFKFQLLDIVKPGPIREIIANYCEFRYSNWTAVEISWKNPSGLRHSRFPLRYQVELRSEWNESFEYAVNQASKRHDNDDNDEDVFSLVINLSWYTEYNVSVRAHPLRNSGYWSETTSLSFRTLESAPSVGPDIEDYTSSRDCDEAESGNCRNVTIFWKELSTRQRNGVIVAYNVTVSPSTPHRDKRSDVEATTKMLTVAAAGDTRSASVRLARDLDYRVQVLACTREGCSKPGSSISVPSQVAIGQKLNPSVWVVVGFLVAVAVVSLVIGIIRFKRYLRLNPQVPEVVVGRREANDPLLNCESSQVNHVDYNSISDQATMDTVSREEYLLATCSTDVEQTSNSADLALTEDGRPRPTSAHTPIGDIGYRDDVISEEDRSAGYSKTWMQEGSFCDSEPVRPASHIAMATGSSAVSIETEEQEKCSASGDYSTGFLETARPVVLDSSGYQATGITVGEEEEPGGSSDESATYVKVVGSDCTGQVQFRREEIRVETSL